MGGLSLTSASDSLFLLNKCWEYPDKSIALQVFLRSDGQRNGAAKKAFLVIDLNQAECGIRLCSAKPRGEPKPGAVSALIRKYLLRCHITALWCDSASSDLWLVFHEPPHFAHAWYLYLARSLKPPLLSLINPDGISLLRISSAATYTKAHPHTGPLPDFAGGGFTPEALQLDDKTTSTENSSSRVTEQPDMASEQKVLRDRLKRKLKTLKQSLNKMQGNIPSKEELEKLSRDASLLKDYLHLVDPEASLLVLSTDLTGYESAISIELKADISAGQNLQLYFSRLKKRKTAFAIQYKMVEKLKTEIHGLENDLENLQHKSCSMGEIAALASRYQLLRQPPPPATREEKGASFQVLPYRLFDIPGLARILVGKGPRESDVMLKKAKANDLWLHIVTGTGTHVLVDQKSFKSSGLTEKVWRAGAILAIHYSQYRATRSGEVYLSQRGNIKKQKGMPDGLWKIERAQTIVVHYDEKELKGILDHRVS